MSVNENIATTAFYAEENCDGHGAADEMHFFSLSTLNDLAWGFRVGSSLARSSYSALSLTGLSGANAEKC